MVSRVAHPRREGHPFRLREHELTILVDLLELALAKLFKPQAVGKTHVRRLRCRTNAHARLGGHEFRSRRRAAS